MKTKTPAIINLHNRAAKFGLGDVIMHRKQGYRGVVVDVDAEFEGREEWLDDAALATAPKDHPWYRVLVDGSDMETYVVEDNLEVDDLGEPVEHPHVDFFFSEFYHGHYVSRQTVN
ncbi:MAG: heat shock protein HspQ [Gammaproteobacteria bacterium]|nr:heat shock protein HspQ [Gammaproteobacteria bacterium]